MGYNKLSWQKQLAGDSAPTELKVCLAMTLPLMVYSMTSAAMIRCKLHDS